MRRKSLTRKVKRSHDTIEIIEELPEESEDPNDE